MTNELGTTSTGSDAAIHGAVLPEGTLLAGRYRIEMPIGAGGFGTVYRARQLPLEREVAVKVLPADALLVPERIARFEHEAALFQRLEHPNTVRLLDFGIANEGAPFIVMELLRGESLATLIEREGPQSEARAASLASDVLKALMEAHSLGIVHRDIKPANIFITHHAGEPFFVKLLDFGIAKETGGDALASTKRPGEIAQSSASLTGANEAMGTPRYMAPEQAFGEVVTPATDLYSLGLTLAEMLSGKPVFATENVAEIVSMQCSTDPVPLATQIEASRLGAIIERATRKLPGERFDSAETMLAAIGALGSFGDVTQTSASDIPIVAPSLAFAPTEATPLVSRRAGARAVHERGGVRVIAFFLGVLVLSGAFATYLFVRRSNPVRSEKEIPTSSANGGISFPKVKIRPGDEAALAALLKGDDWRDLPLGVGPDAGTQPPTRNALADVVLTVRKGKCLANITLGVRADEGHAKVFADNVAEQRSTTTVAGYDGPRIIAITAAAYDPGAVPQDCLLDLEHLILR